MDFLPDLELAHYRCTCLINLYKRLIHSALSITRYKGLVVDSVRYLTCLHAVIFKKMQAGYLQSLA